MTKHVTGTREEWPTADRAAHAARSGQRADAAGDEVARQRQALPWVRVDKTYRFGTEDGKASLADSFRAHAARRLPLHVRARLHGGLSVLLGDCGRLRRVRRAPGQP